MKKPVKKLPAKKSSAKKSAAKKSTKPVAKSAVKKRVVHLKSAHEMSLENENKTLRELVRQACELALDGADVVASSRVVDASDDVIFRSRVDIVADNAGVQLNARPFVTKLDDEGDYIWWVEGEEKETEDEESDVVAGTSVPDVLIAGVHFFVERNGGEWHRTVGPATACKCGIEVTDERTLKIRGTDDTSYHFSPNLGFCFDEEARGTGKQRPDHGGGMAGHDEDGDYPVEKPSTDPSDEDPGFGKSGYEDKEPQDAA